MHARERNSDAASGRLTLGNLLVAMIAVFFLFLAVWMFIAVFTDIFTRHDLSGWGKAGWTL